MKVLLAGANSYIGTNLIPVLLQKGHQVVCLVRDPGHFRKSNNYSNAVTVISGDLLRRKSIAVLPEDIDAAYYLVNNFAQTSGFAALGAVSAQNFIEVVNDTDCRQIITLCDMNNHATDQVIAKSFIDDILSSGKPELTTLNATMIVGGGSMALALFNALTAKAPIIITQNWLKTHLQPIAISNVLEYMELCLLSEKTFNRKFDIGGPEVLLFKQMLLVYIAIFKDFKPSIIVLPFLSAQLSAHLLNTLTPESYPGAQSLVETLKYDSICRENRIRDIFPIQCITFKQSLGMVKGCSVGA